MDDWGADFVGGIVLTPKTSGPRSLWDHGRTALQEESEGSDGSCSAKFDDSVRLNPCVCITANKYLHYTAAVRLLQAKIAAKFDRSVKLELFFCIASQKCPAPNPSE